MDARRELGRIVMQRSTIKGDFLLRSGVKSKVYFDKYLFEADPIMLHQVTHAMCDLLPPEVDALAGLEMGGIPLVTMLSQHTGLPSLFIRRESKKYGTCKLAEGGEINNRKLVVVEDVVTSGGQILSSVKTLRGLGAIIQCVVCVMDREAGGFQNLARENLELRALFKISELGYKID